MAHWLATPLRFVPMIVVLSNLRRLFAASCMSFLLTSVRMHATCGMLYYLAGLAFGPASIPAVL